MAIAAGLHVEHPVVDDGPQLVGFGLGDRETRGGPGRGAFHNEPVFLQQCCFFPHVLGMGGAAAYGLFVYWWPKRTDLEGGRFCWFF